MNLRLPIDKIHVNPNIYISQRFGGNAALYAPYGMKGHNGWDIAAPLGTPIKAAADGFIVEQTATESGYGLRITQRVKDGPKNYLLIYGHMERLQNPVNFDWNWKRTSNPVKAGDVIGYVDSTGFSTGHHLHFGVHEYTENGAKLNSNNGYLGAIDPGPFLGKQTMNQARVVKSKTSPDVYVCYKMPDMDYLNKKASIEGFLVPADIPNTDTL